MILTNYLITKEAGKACLKNKGLIIKVFFDIIKAAIKLPLLLYFSGDYNYGRYESYVERNLGQFI